MILGLHTQTLSFVDQSLLLEGVTCVTSWYKSTESVTARNCAVHVLLGVKVMPIDAITPLQPQQALAAAGCSWTGWTSAHQ